MLFRSRASVPESARVEVSDVGAPPPNLAVVATRVSVDRLVATIRNTGARPRDARVGLTVDAAAGERVSGQSPADAAVSVGPNQTADVTFPLPSGRSAVVSVEDRDGIQGDNRRYVVLDGGGGQPVLVVTATGSMSRDAFYLQQALAVGAARASAAEGVAGAGLQPWDQSRMDAHAAVFVLSTQGLERRGRELLAQYVKKGGGVLVAAGADIDGQVIADALGDIKDLTLPAPSGEGDAAVVPRAFAPTDVRHPIFAAFGQGGATLGLVKFQRVRVVRSACQVLARFTTGEPALVECPLGTGRVLIFASDLDNRWNDFPLHATFVPFVHEILRYLSAARISLPEYVAGDTPPGVPDRPGIASAAGEGGTNRLVAVNVDPRESDGSRLSDAEFQSAVTRLKDMGEPAVRVEARRQEDRQQFWRYALVMMIATLAAESLVAKRTA